MSKKEVKDGLHRRKVAFETSNQGKPVIKKIEKLRDQSLHSTLKGKKKKGRLATRCRRQFHLCDKSISRVVIDLFNLPKNSFQNQLFASV